MKTDLKYYNMSKNIYSTLLLFILLSLSARVEAQFGEPELKSKAESRNLYNEGYKSGFGFLFTINDFGFGAGGQFRKTINTNTEGLLTLRITGIKDPKEQTYIDYYFGFKTTPNKYKRIISFPLNIGVKRRLFAEQISDNFRVFTSVSAGPVLAYSFPYFNDSNNNGFQENNVNVYGISERAYDIFSGWKDGEPHYGWNGDVQIGIDFGSNFANLTTLQFGYTFNYFKKGLQIMQPKEPKLTPSGQLQYDDMGELLLKDSFDARKFYGSAQISFIFGWMWK